MKTTIEFLDAIKVRYNLPSDGRLAAKLELTRSAVSRFMGGKDFLGDETAMKVAALLDADPAYVVACIHAERAKRPEEKKLWNHISAMLMSKHGAGIAAALALVALLPMVDIAGDGTNLAFAGAEVFGSTLYIMSNIIACYWPLLFIAAALALYYFPRHTPRPKKPAN